MDFVLLHIRVRTSTSAVRHTVPNRVSCVSQKCNRLFNYNPKYLKVVLCCGKRWQPQLPCLCEMYHLNIKTWSFSKASFTFTKSVYYCLMFHANLQQVILHIVTNSYLLAVNRLLWHICISEKQFDNINEIFNDTLNIHPCHPYIYLKLQKILYHVLLQYENAHMCQTLPPHTPKNNILVNYIILLSPSPIRKLQTISLSLMLLPTYTHTHFIRSNYHCPLYTEMSCQWLVAVYGHKRSCKDQWTHINPLCENIFCKGHLQGKTYGLTRGRIWV